MNKINLCNQDGSLCSEAQLLILSRPNDISLSERRKTLKEFRSKLSIEDVKEFERLRKKKLQSEYHISKQRDAKRKEQELIANTKKINLYNQDGSLCSEAQFLLSFRSSNMSKRDWNKRTKAFKSQLSAADIKEFERLKKNKISSECREVKRKRQSQRSMEHVMRVSLYEQDGSLHPEAQFLMSFKSSNMSMGDWKKRTKSFTTQLSAEDLKEFERLRRNAKGKAWREDNPEKSKRDKAKWRAENPEKVKKTNANWRAENPEKLKERRKKPKNKLRTAVSMAFNRIGQNKPTNTLKLLGCTWEEAKAHMESLFLEGMTWENHGKGDGKWQIDHIRPVASFSGASEEELKQMNHISNLQPLWAIDNIKKGDKWEENDTLKY